MFTFATTVCVELFDFTAILIGSAQQERVAHKKMKLSCEKVPGSTDGQTVLILKEP